MWWIRLMRWIRATLGYRIHRVSHIHRVISRGEVDGAAGPLLVTSVEYGVAASRLWARGFGVDGASGGIEPAQWHIDSGRNGSREDRLR